MKLALTVSIREAVVPERLPEIDADLRVGKIELASDAIEWLLGDRISWHKKCEGLMPLTSAGDLFLGQVFHFRCYSLHANPRLL